MARWHTQKSQHYIFHFRNGSLAAKEIVSIEKLQEDCYADITEMLGVTMPWPISYFLCSSREEVGSCYGDGVPINAFAREPNLIYATYNETIKCIGPHEGAHLISYQLAKPPWRWLREGVAMYFDKTQHGLPLEAWVWAAARLKILPESNQLWSDVDFDGLNELMSYPLVGFLTGEMIKTIGMEGYRAFYVESAADGLEVFQKTFSTSFADFYSRAASSLERARHDPASIKLIEKLLTAGKELQAKQ